MSRRLGQHGQVGFAVDLVSELDDSGLERYAEACDLSGDHCSGVEAMQKLKAGHILGAME